MYLFLTGNGFRIQIYIDKIVIIHAFILKFIINFSRHFKTYKREIELLLLCILLLKSNLDSTYY